MEDDLCRKRAFMDDDLWWKVPSKRWFRSIFLRSSSSLRSSQCLMSYSFLWKMTSMEDDLWRKTTFDGRRPRMARLTFVSLCAFMLLQNNAFGLSLCKTTFDGRRPLMEDHLWWKTAFDGRWPLMEDDRLFCKMTFMDDDLWWRVPSKWWWCSICLRSSSFLRLSECLMSYSFLEDDLYGRRPLMEGHLWWFTLLLGVYVVWGYFEIRLLVYLSRGS